jgi:hypothetical protein
MRNCRKIVALLLALAVISGVAGCAKAKPLTKDNLIAELESYGIEKVDEPDTVLAAMSRRGGTAKNYYIAENEDDAAKLSNVVLNRFGNMNELNATGLVLTIINEEGSDGKSYNSYLVFLTFDDAKEANKAYKDIVDAYGDEEDGKTGTKSNTTYCVDCGVSAAGHNKIGTGIYLQDNAVVFLRADSAVKDKFKFADTICGNLGLPLLPKAS